MTKKTTEKSNPKTQLEVDLEVMDSEFVKTQITPAEIEVLLKVKEAIRKIDIGIGPNEFNSWPIEKLIEARERLSRYSETLGEHIAEHEIKSDFAYIWRKGAYAKDWLPLKEKFPKSTISDLESTLDQKYIVEQYYCMFHRRRADVLIREIEAVDRMIRTVDHRIRELERQYRLEYNNIKPNNNEVPGSF